MFAPDFFHTAGKYDQLYTEELIPQFNIHRIEDRMDTIAAGSRVMSLAALTAFQLWSPVGDHLPL